MASKAKRSDTGIPGLSRTAIGESARVRGLYVLFENKGERIWWVIYQVSTGRQIGTYFPANRHLLYGCSADQVECQNWKDALRRCVPVR